MARILAAPVHGVGRERAPIRVDSYGEGDGAYVPPAGGLLPHTTLNVLASIRENSVIYVQLQYHSAFASK
jgi:hypothetical protein